MEKLSILQKQTEVIRNEWENLKTVQPICKCIFWGKKEQKDNQIKQGRENANKFFMRVLKERSETSCVDT